MGSSRWIRPDYPWASASITCTARKYKHIDYRMGRIVHPAFIATNRRRSSFGTRSCVLTAILLLVLCGGYVRVGAISSEQSDPAQANQLRELTIERIYGEPSLSGTPTTGIEWSPDSKRISYLVRGPQGSSAGTELWTMDAATGERKLLVNSEMLKTITQPQKTKSTQATCLGRIEPWG